LAAVRAAIVGARSESWGTAGEPLPGATDVICLAADLVAAGGVLTATGLAFAGVFTGDALGVDVFAAVVFVAVVCVAVVFVAVVCVAADFATVVFVATAFPTPASATAVPLDAALDNPVRPDSAAILVETVVAVTVFPVAAVDVFFDEEVDALVAIDFPTLEPADAVTAFDGCGTLSRLSPSIAFLAWLLAVGGVMAFDVDFRTTPCLSAMASPIYKTGARRGAAHSLRVARIRNLCASDKHATRCNQNSGRSVTCSCTV
jgi:hypothetical protein